MGSFVESFRQAGRVLRRSPGFTLSALSTLAIGVGGIIALFSLIHGILLRPLPYPDPDSLVLFHWKSREGVAHAGSANKFLAWEGSSAFSSVAAFEIKSSGATLVGGETPEYVHTLRVSGEFFRTLGIRPVHGRDFLPEEDRPGAPAVVMLSHGLWKRNFNSDPAIVGTPLKIGSGSYAVVGVLPASVRFEPMADVWIPLQVSLEPEGGANLYGIVGRLAKGVGIQQAESQAMALFQSLKGKGATIGPDEVGLYLTRYKDWIVSDIRLNLLLLFGAGALVFLICCINLSNLFMTRALSQAGETATRVALGAGWREIFRQVVTENFLMAVIATLLGLWLAQGIVSTVLSLSPQSLPRAAEVRIGWAEVLFAGLVTILATVLIAVVAFGRIGRGGAGGWLQAPVSSWSGSSRVAGRRLGRVFVVSEVALALAVLASTILMIGTFLRLKAVDPGLDLENVVTFQVPLHGENYQKSLPTWNFSEELLSKVRRLQGVSSAAAVTSLPLDTGLNVPLNALGAADDEAIEVEYRAVSPDYFRCLGIPLQGQGFGQVHGPNSAPVAIVNEALVRHFWGRGRAVGETVLIAKGLGPLEDKPRQVIGVAGDVHEKGLAEPPPPTVYIPLAQVSDTLAGVINQAFPLSFVVHLSQGTTALPDLRRIIQNVDAQQAVAAIRPLSAVVGESIGRERFFTVLLGLFGGVALWLTMVGIYSVTSTHVKQRTREIGLRMAVGARRAEILRLVLGEALRLSLLGITIGVPLALALNHLVGRLIAGVERSGFGSLFVVSLLLTVVALAASYIPARSAARMDPLIALRCD